jgi:hypothetical protein
LPTIPPTGMVERLQDLKLTDEQEAKRIGVLALQGME